MINTNVQNWIKIANKDLQLAQKLLKDSEDEYCAYVCFLCEQAVEKYLKAFLVKHKNDLEPKDRTHHLIYLTNQCKKYKLDLSNYQEELVNLTALYTPTRYPDTKSNGELYQEDATEAIKSAKKVIKFIKPFLQTCLR